MKAVLEGLGYMVFIVPEVPTILLNNGATFPGYDESRQSELLQWETYLLKLQLDFEDAFNGIASITPNSNPKCKLSLFM
jgi:hypothetical protein